MALQHLRSGTAHKRPIPTVMSAGQIAINTNEASPGLFFKDSNGDLVKVGPVHIGTTAPNSSPDSVAATALVTGTVYQILTVGTSDFTLVGASANTVGIVFTATGTTTGTGTVSGQQGVEKGEQWLDTTGGAYDLKIYDGTSWRSQAGEFVNVTGDTMTGALLLDNAASVSAPDLSFDGDANTGIYSPGADQFAVATAGTSRLVIDSSGNVGIGTSSPSAKLHVSSTAGVEALVSGGGTSGDTVLHLKGNGNAFKFLVPNAASQYGMGLYDVSNATYRMFVDSSGNVGIGTTSPQNELHISSGDSATRLQITNSTTGSASGDGTALIQSGNDFYINNRESANLYFATANSTAATIDSSGKVGIGTTSPNHLLTLNTTSGACFMETAGAGYTAGTNSVYYGQDTAGEGYFWNRGNNDLLIGTNNTERMRVDGSGNIKLTFPDGNTGLRNKIAFTTESPYQDETAYIAANRTATSFAPTDLIFATGTSAGVSEKMRLDSSGRLLVGTSSARTDFYNTDGFQLQVEGTNWFNSGISAVCNDNVYGGYLALGRSRGSTKGSTTLVQNADTLGSVDFLGADGSRLVLGARIRAEVDGTPGTNDMPGRLVFSTTADGASSPTERMRINSLGEVSAQGIYDTTSGSAANVYIHPTNYILHRSTSSIKYKTNIETLQDQYADALLNCRPVWYQSVCKYDNPNWGYWGFIAEEVAEIDPRLVSWKTHENSYDENGAATQIPLENPEPEGVQYDRFVPHLLNLIKRQKDQIDAMEARLSALEAS